MATVLHRLLLGVKAARIQEALAMEGVVVADQHVCHGERYPPHGKAFRLSCAGQEFFVDDACDVFEVLAAHV